MVWNIIYFIVGHISQEALVCIYYKHTVGRTLNINNPKNIDEKINWLKFRGDTSKWPILADKYRVRTYIKEKGLDNILVSLYGKWDKAEEINWESLPNQFVMKTNHGSGDVFICRNKSEIDTTFLTQFFSSQLKQKYGNLLGEPHYNKIMPCIIAEELLDNKKQSIKSSSLIDYKIWSFDGKPAYIWICYNRTKYSCEVGVYDLNWVFHPEYSISGDHYKLAKSAIPRPISLDKMLYDAAVLSQGFPQVRIDFYEIEGKPYFGEMTFTSSAGCNDFYTQEFLDILGQQCSLPINCK